jgi:nucleotide-binding universal stress UspA family protein
MKPFLNILVGINEGQSSKHALATAAQIGAREGAKITACRVMPINDLTEFIEFYHMEHKQMISGARESLEDFVTEVLGSDHDVTCQVSEGIPHHEMVSIANEGHYDLLVLGSGDQPEDVRDFGRFATRCLRFADMPVLIVNETPVHPDAPVAACLDFSDSTAPILDQVARIAPRPRPALHLVHACRPPWLQSSFAFLRREPDDDSGEKARFREVIDGQFAVVRERATDLLEAPVETIRLEDHDPDRALLDHFATNPYGLLVLGRSGRGWKGFLTDVLGGTAENLIRHSRCPVLVVPITSK